MARDTLEDVERLRMAMAEAGYPAARVRLNSSGFAEYWRWSVPDRVAWKAGIVAGVPKRCFRCFLAQHEPCLADRSNPGEDCGGVED